MQRAFRRRIGRQIGRSGHRDAAPGQVHVIQPPTAGRLPPGSPDRQPGRRVRDRAGEIEMGRARLKPARSRQRQTRSAKIERDVAQRIVQCRCRRQAQHPRRMPGPGDGARDMQRQMHGAGAIQRQIGGGALCADTRCRAQGAGLNMQLRARHIIRAQRSAAGQGQGERLAEHARRDHHIRRVQRAQADRARQRGPTAPAGTGRQCVQHRFADGQMRNRQALAQQRRRIDRHRHVAQVEPGRPVGIAQHEMRDARLPGQAAGQAGDLHRAAADIADQLGERHPAGRRLGGDHQRQRHRDGQGHHHRQQPQRKDQEYAHQKACPMPIYSSHAPPPVWCVTGTATSRRMGPIEV